MSAASTPLSMGSIPAVGVTEPARINQKMPAIPARNPDSANAPRITESELTPISRAASKSDAAARNDRPNMVRCNSQVVASKVTIVTPITRRSKISMRREPRATVSAAQPGRWMLLTDADTYKRNNAETIKCTPNEVRSMVKSLAPRTRLNAMRSISSELPTAETRMSGTTVHQFQPWLNAQ